ncbi:MAG: hypothetical protein LQ352_007873, partial [Teloschistes flavicans]
MSATRDFISATLAIETALALLRGVRGSNSTTISPDDECDSDIVVTLLQGVKQTVEQTQAMYQEALRGGQEQTKEKDGDDAKNEMADDNLAYTEGDNHADDEAGDESESSSSSSDKASDTHTPTPSESAGERDTNALSNRRTTSCSSKKKRISSVSRRWKAICCTWMI